jgi:hypothetical protein
MDSSKIKLIFIVTVALFAALYLGISAATAQFEAIAWVVGGVTLCTCLLMGRNIWLLIPFLGSMQLTLMIPGRPSSMLVAQALVISFTLLMLLSRKMPFKLRITEMECWMLLLTLCVFQVYARNPVGVNLFGGDQVGGRPYVLYLMAFVTAFILSSISVTHKSLWMALKLSVLGSFCNFAVGLLGWLWAPFGYFFGMASNVMGAPSQQSALDPGQAGRVEFVRTMANTLAVVVSSFRNPLLAVFSVRFAPLVIISLIFAAGSGYRNVVASVGLSYLVGVIYRGGLISLMGSTLLGVIALASLAIINMALPLPANLQRALAFLPGTWEERYVLNTQDSSNWRFEMWEEVLTTDRWIDNKLLGDGLGFSAKELQLQSQLLGKNRGSSVGVSGFDQAREFVLINGDYHSGPVSAIRTIGYVGLCIMLLAQLRIMMHAHRLVLKFKSSEFFPLVLFFCIPMIWFPAFFIFIFGGFQADAIVILLNAGMIRLLQNNLPIGANMQAEA